MSIVRLSTGLTLGAALLLSGCGGGKMLAEKDSEIARKDQELATLRAELDSSRLMTEEENKRIADELKNTFSALENEKKLRLEGNRIIMPNAVLFNSGSVDVSAEGKQILDQIARGLETYARRDILVEGHTDSVPIAKKAQDRFKSNWELAAARAITVVQHLRAKAPLKSSRFGAVSYAESRPVGDNNTEAGRKMNRRVVVVVGGAR